MIPKDGHTTVGSLSFEQAKKLAKTRKAIAQMSLEEVQNYVVEIVRQSMLQDNRNREVFRAR